MDGRTHIRQEDAGEEHASDDGWRLVQLAQLVKDLRAIGDGLSGLLEQFTPEELHAVGTAELEPERRAQMVDSVCALRDAAEQIGWIGGDLAPTEEAMNVSLDAVADAAAAMLAEGSANVALIQLGARLLVRADGYPALAQGIDVEPRATASWGEATIVEVLGSFRDSTEQSTAWVCASARVSSDTAWAALTIETLARLTWALRNASGR